jgi:hypothetical protein
VERPGDNCIAAHLQCTMGLCWLGLDACFYSACVVVQAVGVRRCTAWLPQMAL